MKNWLKENWFRLLILIIATIFVAGFMFINYREYQLKRLRAQQDTLEWFGDNFRNSFSKYIGEREIKNFQKLNRDTFNNPL
ncbi:MAG: hypothetical protein HYY55_03620 [Candidatus Niyogibacteria bacterium]|nr:MAG: hypothetical protein HYY55_03620 [Candidatus Niyogibacteria bacterium]